jgi:hypothetical protein
MAVFWVTVTYDLLIVLMIETASTSEASVNFYQTVRRYNPEESHFHTRCRENLKSYFVIYAHNHNLFSKPSIIRVIKSRSLRMVGNLACILTIILSLLSLRLQDIISHTPDLLLDPSMSFSLI